MGRVTACALRGCRALSLRSPFSPSQPWAQTFPPTNPPIALQSFTRFTHPTHRLLCKSFTRDAPLSQAAMARRRVRRSVPTILPSLLVRPSSGWARWLPTARFDEHRLSKNTMGLACALGEQRKLPSLPIHFLRSRAATGPCGHTLAEAGVTPAHALLFCQFFDEVPELWEDEFFHREADGVF